MNTGALSSLKKRLHDYFLWLSSNPGQLGLALRDYLNNQHVSFSESSLYEALKDDPDFPHLLSGYRVLQGLSIESHLLKLTADHLAKIQVPVLTRIVFYGKESFGSLYAISGGKFEFKTPNTLPLVIGRDQLEDVWDGQSLLAEQGSVAIDNTLLNEASGKRKVLAFALFLFLFTSLVSIFIVVDKFLIATLLLKLLCIGISAILLLQEIGYSHITGRFCKSSGSHSQNDCARLSEMAGSMFLGLKWSSVSLVFFSVFFLWGVIAAMTDSTGLIFVYQLGAVASVVVSFLSLYLQRVKYKIWCRLCIAINLLIWLDAGILLIVLPTGTIPQFSSIIALSITTVFIITVIYFLNRIYVLQSKIRLVNQQFNRINTPAVRQFYMQHQPAPDLEKELALPTGIEKEVVVFLSLSCFHCKKAFEDIAFMIDDQVWSKRLQIIVGDQTKTTFAYRKLAVALLQISESPVYFSLLRDWFLYEMAKDDPEGFIAKHVELQVDFNNETEGVYLDLLQSIRRIGVLRYPSVFYKGHYVPAPLSIRQVLY